jgi:hypothetical protein
MTPDLFRDSSWIGVDAEEYIPASRMQFLLLECKETHTATTSPLPLTKMEGVLKLKTERHCVLLLCITSSDNSLLL